MLREQTVITDIDQRRLRTALDQSARRSERAPRELGLLRERVRAARVVGSRDVPANVVTMNSLVVLRDLDSGNRLTCRLAYPHEARLSRQSVSVSHPLGTAMLGKRVGQVVRWPRAAADRRLRI